MATKTRSYMRVVRHSRIRKTLTGTTEQPRLSVFRSGKHISAQIIDDTNGHTIAAASSQEKDLKAANNTEGAAKVGAALAKRATAAGLKKVVFDRGGFRYHGVLAALAQGARDGGLEF